MEAASSHRGRRHVPRGSVIAELAVVLLIAAVLGSLLLPAVARSRAAARRAQCLNNLQNLTLALHTYEAQWGTLPPGGDGPPGGTPPGWLARLAPQLDAQALAASIDLNAGADDRRNATAAAAQISILLCPADPGSPPGSTNYAGISGGYDVPLGPENGGAFPLGRGVRLAEILDGPAHTMLVAEKPVGRDGGGSWLAGDASSLRTTAHPPNARGPNRAAVGDRGPGGLASGHGAGIHAGFGDGGVRWVRDGVSPEILRQWGERADGELPAVD